MKKFLVVLAFCLGGCVTSHAVLRTEIVINGKPNAGEIYCTDEQEPGCKEAMAEFCQGKVSIVKSQAEQLCYLQPSLFSLDKPESEKVWERTCDSVRAVYFFCAR